MKTKYIFASWALDDLYINFLAKLHKNQLMFIENSLLLHFSRLSCSMRLIKPDISDTVLLCLLIVSLNIAFILNMISAISALSRYDQKHLKVNHSKSMKSRVPTDGSIWQLSILKSCQIDVFSLVYIMFVYFWSYSSLFICKHFYMYINKWLYVNSQNKPSNASILYVKTCIFKWNHLAKSPKSSS